MRFIPVAAFLSGLAGLALAPCLGALSLSLSSDEDLSRLRVGQAVTIRVELRGLSSGQQLDALSAGVQFDDTVFAPTASVRAGEIVPSLAAPPVFQTLNDPGFADGLFEAIEGEDPSDRIGRNGAFFSFDLAVARAGSGQLGFDFADALLRNPRDPFEPIEVDVAVGDALQVTATGGGGGGATVIPLPPAVAMGCLGLAGVFGGQAARRWRARREACAR